MSDWWITTGLLERGGKKVRGPFRSMDEAVGARGELEAAEGHENYCVDED